IYLPPAGGISGNRATVRLTTTSATSSTTTDHTTRRPSSGLGCFRVCSAIVGQVLVLLSPVAISDAYFRDLLNRGDYSRHDSDNVACEVRVTDYRQYAAHCGAGREDSDLGPSGRVVKTHG